MWVFCQGYLASRFICMFLDYDSCFDQCLYKISLYCLVIWISLNQTFILLCNIHKCLMFTTSVIFRAWNASVKSSVFVTLWYCEQLSHIARELFSLLLLKRHVWMEAKYCNVIGIINVLLWTKWSISKEPELSMLLKVKYLIFSHFLSKAKKKKKVSLFSFLPKTLWKC